MKGKTKTTIDRPGSAQEFSRLQRPKRGGWWRQLVQNRCPRVAGLAAIPLAIRRVRNDYETYRYAVRAARATPWVARQSTSALAKELSTPESNSVQTGYVTSAVHSILELAGHR